MNISLSDNLKAFVDQRVQSGGFSSHSEYVRELVRRDELEMAKAKLRGLVADGLASPPGEPWETTRDRLLAQAASAGQ